MFRSRFRSVLISILVLGLITIFGSYLHQNADRYLNLLQISPLLVSLILILTVVSMLVNGVISINLLKGLGVDLSIRDGVLLTAASTLANQLPISGGILTRAFYLKHKYNVSYAKFLSATLALFFCFISVNGVIGITILLYWILFRKIRISFALLFGFIVMAAWLMVFWIPVEHIKISRALRARLVQALEGWRLISSKPVLVGRLVGLQTVLMLVLAIRYWLAFRMLSQYVGIDETILFSSASILTQLISIAPGGLGVTEAIVGGVASLLGFDIGVSVVAVGLDRLISTVVIFLLGGISTIALGRQYPDPRIGDP